MSIWIYKHDTRRGIKKKVYIQPGFLFIILAICLWYKKQLNAFPTPPPFTEKKGIKSWCVTKTFLNECIKIFHPWNLQQSTSKTENLLCKVKFKPFLSLLCAKNKGHTWIWVTSPVMTSQFIWPVLQCPPLWISITQEPSLPAGYQRRSRCLTLPRATRSLSEISCMLGFWVSFNLSCKLDRFRILCRSAYPKLSMQDLYLVN